MTIDFSDGPWSKTPRPGMKWSDEHRKWLDPYRRTAERRRKDEEIARDVEAEFARRMGTPQPSVARLEAGSHSPTLSTRARYETAIGVDLAVRRPD